MVKKKKKENIIKPITELKSERWNDKEIKKVAKILLEAEQKKSVKIRLLDEIVHWMILMLVIFGNILMAGFIVIVSGLLTPIYTYIIILVIALFFGFMIEIPLKDLKKLSKSKHDFSRVMLPVLAIVNIFIIIGIKNSLEFFTDIKFDINPIIMGIVYGLFFLIPHILTSLKRK